MASRWRKIAELLKYGAGHLRSKAHPQQSKSSNARKIGSRGRDYPMIGPRIGSDSTPRPKEAPNSTPRGIHSNTLAAQWLLAEGGEGCYYDEEETDHTQGGQTADSGGYSDGGEGSGGKGTDGGGSGDHTQGGPNADSGEYSGGIREVLGRVIPSLVEVVIEEAAKKGTQKFIGDECDKVFTEDQLQIVAPLAGFCKEDLEIRVNYKAVLVKSKEGTKKCSMYKIPVWVKIAPEECSARIINGELTVYLPYGDNQVTRGEGFLPVKWI